MSNTQVGNIYQTIILEVITQCRAPFEEEGANAQILEDFKSAWKANLNARGVAVMPWDKEQTQAPQVAPQPRQQPTQYVPPPQQAPTGIDVKPTIKTEPADLANLPAPNFPHSTANVALHNAQNALRERFGDKADASIQQMNERVGEPQGTKRPHPQSSPIQQDFDAKRRLTEYQQQNQQQAQQRLHQLNAAQRSGPPHVGPGQTDGAADWKQIVEERRALTAEDTAAADMSIAERVAALQRAEEGNGIMQPASLNRKRAATSVTKRRDPAGPSGFDGVDDDDDEDKDDVDDADAINSDLDDDEEDNLEDDEDEEVGREIMVCTYEKVARVKNKWKCTLKDGILITGGKEYVFSKATGEFEW